MNWTSRSWMLLLCGLVALGGCKDDEKKPEETKVEVTPEKEPAAAVPVAKLEAPAGVLAFGGAKSLAEATKNLGGVPDPSAITGQLQTMLGLPKLDAQKPMRFLLGDPEKEQDGALILAIEVGDKAAVEAVLPETKKADDEGNAYSYPGPSGKKVYVNTLENYAVFSRAKEAFGTHRAFLEKVTAAEVAGSGATAILSVKNASTLYKKELTQAFDEIAKTPKEASGMGAGQMAEMAEGFKAIVGEIDTVALTLDAVDGGSTAHFIVNPIGGSDFEGGIKGLKAKTMSYLAKLPAATKAGAVIAMEPELGGLAEKIFAWSLRLSLGDDDPELLETTKAYWKASTGEIAYALTEVPGVEGRVMTAITGITDQETVLNYQKAALAMYEKTSFKDKMAALGVSFEVQPDAYEIDGAKATVVKTKGDAAKDPVMASMFGALGEQHIIVGKDLQIMSYGDNAKKVAEAWLGGTVPGGFEKSPAVVRALGHKAPGTFMFAWADLGVVAGSVMGAFAPSGGAGQAPEVPPTPDGVAMSLGAKDGQLHLVLDLPKKTLDTLAQMAGPPGL
ncbi:MAG: hypothetical protein AAF715_10250 [Myxococcota bacterium]